MLSLHRSIAGASALARRHPKIIGNRPTAATAAANRLASASHHQARATFQPTGRFFLPRLRPPATVEIPIGPSHYPPSPSSQTRSFNRACAPVTGAQTLIRSGPPNILAAGKWKRFQSLGFIWFGVSSSAPSFFLHVCGREIRSNSSFPRLDVVSLPSPWPALKVAWKLRHVFFKYRQVETRRGRCALLVGSAWRCEILYRPRRCLARADTKSRVGAYFRCQARYASRGGQAQGWFHPACGRSGRGRV